MKKRLSLVLLNIILCLSAFGVLFGYSAVAKADGPTYTVKFWLDEEKTEEYADARQTVEENAYAKVPVTPLKDGNVFLFWQVNSAKFSFNKTPITENVDLTAAWYLLDVKFSVGGEVVNAQSVERGKDAIAPTNFTLPEGKVFAGWDVDFTNVQRDLVVNAIFTDAEYTVTVVGFGGAIVKTFNNVTHGGSVDLSSVVIPEIPNYHVTLGDEFDGTATNVTKDREIAIKYVPNQYTATFTVSDEEYDKQTVKYGDYVRFPSIPEKTGYIFQGWFNKTNDLAFDFNSFIESDVEIYAKYQVIENKKYDVTFYNYDGVQYGAVQRVEEGKTVIPAGFPVREGYDFMGWYIVGDSRELYDFDTPVTEDISLYAQFKIKYFTVTVISDGQEFPPQTVKYGGNAVEPQITAKEGYIFTGFDASFKDIRKDTVINATFRLKTFAVMFIDSYGKKMCTTQYIEYGKSAKAPKVPELEGYTFLQWSEDYENVTDDMVVVPLYEKITYDFTYMLDGDIYETRKVEYGHIAVNLVPTKEGYIFRGWFTDAGCEETYAYDFNSAVTESRVLYGAFDIKPAEQFTVTFTVDGAIYAMYSVEYGHNCPTPNPPNKYGHIFKGWEGDYSNVTEDTVIAAKFDKMQFTVRPMGFMGAGPEHEFKVEYGEYITENKFPANVPEKEGYTFGGWDYDATQSVTQDITVYAIYNINVYTVTFTVDGEIYDTQNVKYGSHAVMPDQPYVYGKTFRGWFVGETTFDFREGVISDVTVTAKLRTVERSVYYYLDGSPYAEEKYEVGSQIVKRADPDVDEHTDFYGWQGLPDNMIMPNGNVFVYGYTYTHHAFTVTYYINGKVYAKDTYYDGDAVTVLGAPSADALKELSDSDTVFVKWGEVPAIMPVYNCTVNAELLKYYYVTYYIEGCYNERVRILEGNTVTPKGTPELPTGVVFVGWEGEPAIMPDHDVMVEGTIMKNYTITYYVNGVMYREVEVFQGDAVQPLDLPQGYEDFVVDGWDGEPATMPTYDVEVNAIIRFKYTITYYIDGKVYDTVKLPVGDAVPKMGTPETDEDTVFIGWEDEFTIMPSGGGTVNAIVKHYYMIWYNIDNELYYSERVLEGSAITSLIYGNDIEGIIFHGWNNEPEIMPAKSVLVTADITKLNKYTLFYMVDGDRQYKTVSVYEGYPVTPLTESFDPAQYGYEGVFGGWQNEPETMPSNNVYVTARIRLYRTISYYIGDRWYSDVRVIEGDAVTPLSAPDSDRLEINEVFIRWGNEPQEMPNENVRVNAELQILQKYTITYYVGNEWYTACEYYETKPVTPQEAPKKEIYGKEFVRWIGEPKNMPSENVRVNAEYADKTKYTITYYLDGEFYATAEYFEGESVRNMEAPIILEPNVIFDGWKDEPKVMPAESVKVYGTTHKEIVGTNVFVLSTVSSDDREWTLTFKITGEVNIAGFAGVIEFDGNAFSGCNAEPFDTGDYTTVFVVENTIRIMWTHGYNLLQENEFITITLTRSESGAQGDVNIYINEAYAFDADGEIVSVEYSAN